VTGEPGLPDRTGGVEAWEAEGTADHLLDRLEGEGWRALQALTATERAARLGAAGARFLDPADPLTREAVARVPEDAFLSTEGAREVVRGMARDWTGDRLRAALRSDFPDPAVLDGFRPGPEGDAIRALPPRLLVQVGAGNVPGTGATALLRGLLVGAPTLLKPGTGDGVLPVLMARAIQELAPELAPALAVTPWRGGGGGLLEERALARAERVVVYGGWETIRSVRERVPPGVSVVEYGHRVSVGVVTRSALSPGPAATSAQDAAAAVSAYEQRGCVSPHAIWVEVGGHVAPERWAELLGKALAARSRRVPPSPDPGAMATVRQLRDAAELREAAGRGNRVLGGPPAGWMVLFEPEPRLELSCRGRTVRVHPVEDASAVPALLRPVRGFLQSCAVAGEEPDRRRVAAGLAEAGITRITTFRRLAWPPAWWHHDGKGPLRALVRWVGLEEDGDA
jgi:hypothetical protein